MVGYTAARQVLVISATADEVVPTVVYTPPRGPPLPHQQNTSAKCSKRV